MAAARRRSPVGADAAPRQGKNVEEGRLITWFKVDDGLALHAKTVAAGNAAMGLWVRAGAWSAQQLTDGYVPTAIARTLGTAGEARALVAAGLWAAEEGGYRFWQWQQRNPSRSDVEAERIAAKERMRSRRVRPNIAARSPEVPANAPSKPDECSVAPSRPVPTHTTTPPAGRDLIAEWIEACPKRPPESIIKRVGAAVRGMLADGIDPDDVHRGLDGWQAKGLDPSTLPSVVNQVMNAHPIPRGQAETDARFARQMQRAQEADAREPR